MVARAKPQSEALLFDHTLLEMRARRTQKKFSEYDFLFRWTAEQLEDRLLDIARDFPNALQVGDKATMTSDKIDALKTIGLADMQSEILPTEPQSHDLILAPLQLHHINDLPGMLIQIRRALKADGLFLGAMFGGGTLWQLKEALTQTEIALKGGLSPRISPFADKQQMGGLMQRAGFALPVVDSDIVTVTYKDIFALMHDLRGMGENNILSARDKSYPGRDFFKQAGAYYQDHFSGSDGRIEASFEIIFLTGWAPHDSQQKPLRPGSAEQSLKDVL